MMLPGLRRRLHPWSVVWIVFMWNVLSGEFSWGNTIAGFLVAVVVILGLPLPQLPVSALRIRWLPLLQLVVIFAWDLLVSSLRVSWLAIRPQPQPPSAIVTVPMRVQEDLVFAFAVALLNLTPGGTVTDLDIANRMLTMHILDARSTAVLDKTIASIATLERLLIRIFETEVKA
ncbi:Na+/H+ antiporter subunit E [Corynebacterium epidermidicanis]|uniref:Multisubunit sodium/proton antiporter, MrpE subunit n=1 Tax=Corynebacterium epidermidicanis TaxID=1050174 RepID=A0A0G3GWT8_9CORY|nr:Na+/H+ antiporter subunit E [Corynebacterium epidermidicanis]AKK04013.1 multisubunit sodium/proton antiporter, MrpE subunit [Corynebacterium epidermidicanis]